jgi:hypothetical protein
LLASDQGVVRYRTVFAIRRPKFEVGVPIPEQ